jgi:hypothetical protein
MSSHGKPTWVTVRVRVRVRVRVSPNPNPNLGPDENVVGALADADLVVQASRLAHLIERHHDDRRAVALDDLRLVRVRVRVRVRVGVGVGVGVGVRVRVRV